MLLSILNKQIKGKQPTVTTHGCKAKLQGFGKNGLTLGLLCLTAMCLPTACIDKSYDVSDVDLTMGLGSDGLKVKLGNTEKIYLKDIIDTDGNTKLDADNRFYLTEQGSTELTYTVQAVTSSIEGLARVNCTQRVLGWNADFWNQMGAQGIEAITVPAGTSLHGTAEGENKADFSTDGIGQEVKRIMRVYPKDFGATLTVSMLSSANVDFTLDRLEDFSITLPKYVHLREVPQGWTLDGQRLIHQGSMTIGTARKQVCAVSIDYIDLEEEGIPTNGQIRLSQEMTRVAMRGTAYFNARRQFTMHEGDYADIMLDIQFPHDGQITVDSIRGIFDPQISPDIDPINLWSNLPDFLKDEATKIKVSNPTLKFMVDMRSLPVGANVAATLTSVKGGSQGWSQSVALPQLTMQSARRNVAYYHQSEDSPYDPEAQVGANAIVQRVGNLGSLIERLPERIEVDMKGGKVSLLQQEATMRMGYTYRAQTDYSVFVPLQVEQGFTIVYRDSTESLDGDLDDYSAQGITLSTTAQNTIPLALTLQVQACDAQGKPIPGIAFTTAHARTGQGENKAPVTTEMQMEGNLERPSDLKLIDHFVFSVTAQSDEAGQTAPLAAQQYIRLTDIRLRLKGAVTGNFN